jgi:hypothetical protein
LLVLDPNSHARLKACRLSPRVEAQAKRVAVMIPNNPLGLPRSERSERSQSGDRENFKRVGWSSPRGTGKDTHGIQWFEQVRFAGNHSDIGGSYPENQSRLSDIALDWMLRWAVAIPNGLKFDRQVLRTGPI